MIAITLVCVLALANTAFAQDVDGGLTGWIDETDCDKTCGGGTKFQFRACTNPSPSGNGLPCDPEAATFQQIACNTQACDQVCEAQKPCSCENIPKYTPANVPTNNLLEFPNINPMDMENARDYLRIWTKENFAEFCEDAKCVMSSLDSGIANITTYVDVLDAMNSFHADARGAMHRIIDCNDNVEIEGQLWSVYDFMCEQGVAIKEIYDDLEQKKEMFESEKDRCKDSTCTALQRSK